MRPWDSYPEGQLDVIDIGDRHFLWPIRNNGVITGFMWWHDCPLSRSWSWFGTWEGQRSGNNYISLVEPITIGGSLLCPSGCGDHGFVTAGRWVAIPPP